MFTKAIVCPPAPNFAEGLTTAGLGSPDYQLALKQHEAYCKALERCGLTLIRLEADSRHPDSCFVEDTALIFNALPIDHPTRAARAGTPVGRATAPNVSAQAVLTRPGAASRTGEVETIRAVFTQTFHKDSIHQIEPPGTLDGGDVCEAGNRYFIGISARTNEHGAERLANLVAAHGYSASFIDIRADDSLLHLKSGLAHLGDNRVVVTESLAGRKEFAEFDLVRVEPREEYAANCVRVNDYVLVADGHNHFQQTLRDLGYHTIALDMSEFQKMDGGLSCLSVRW